MGPNQRSARVMQGSCALFLCLLLCPPAGHALERWVAGEGGVGWNTVIDAHDSRSVEVTPQGYLQPDRAEPEGNLSIGVYDRGGWYTGAGAALVWSGSINGAFDDDPGTAAHINHSNGRITVDLGASYPMTRIRFSPRPGFPLRFIPGFELFVNNGDLPPDFSGMDMWNLARYSSQGSTLNLIDWEPLYERRENLESDVELTFPRQYARFVQITGFETATWEISEFEVYGEGYVRAATFVSKVIDLHGAADFGNVAWDAEIDPGAQLVVHSRSGSTSDPFRYYRLTGIGPTGQTRLEDTNRNGTAWDEYNSLRDDRGDMVLDTDHWSYWSPPYASSSGGDPMLSPGPRRYVQFQFAFQAGTTFDDGVRVKSLSLEYSRPPLAERVIGEISPTQVAAGAVTTFTYALAGAFAAGQSGFDAIEISTPVAVDPATVREVTVGGVPVDAAVTAHADHLAVRLPLHVRRAEDTVRLVFDCPVFVSGTRFGGSVFDQNSVETRQLIIAGDALSELAADELSVGWPLAGDLIGDLLVTPGVITPNGDGVNDAASITFSVLQVLTSAEVTARIFDLSGRLVWTLCQERGAGLLSVVWPAVNGQGERVPPGTYVYRIAVDAAAGADSRTGLIAVAY